MLLRRQTLRSRIVNAYLLLAVFLCGSFAVLAFFSVKAIEDRLVDARLVEAGDKLIDIHLQGRENSVPGDPRVWSGSQVPVELGGLPVGIHEISLDRRSLHVLVRDRSGQRHVIVDDESEYERIEGGIWRALAVGFVLCVALAVVLGLLTASKFQRCLQYPFCFHQSVSLFQTTCLANEVHHCVCWAICED